MFTEFLNFIHQLKKNIYLAPYKEQSKQRIYDYVTKNQDCIKLNIGSGATLIPGYLNGDIWTHPGTVYMNVSEKLPFDDQSVKFIKCEHMVEHLDYSVCQFFFSECYRVLHRDGVLRISTPSLEKIISLYLGKGQISHSELIEHHQNYHNRPNTNICSWFNDHMRLWGHEFIFDQTTLFSLLKQAGFREIQEVEYGKSQHLQLQNIETHDEGVEWMKSAYVMIFEVNK
ncbi:MAG: class I SAM-dependent methyltransferase [Dolichospermum sp.]|jgi:predicted SAM-dependent methyltransferase